MTIQERIYSARKRWECSFEMIAFLLDMDRDEVFHLYCEYKNSLLNKHTITVDDDVIYLGLNEYCTNLLRRNGIHKIKDALTLTERKILNWNYAGELTARKILDSIQRIRAVLEGSQDDRS